MTRKDFCVRDSFSRIFSFRIVAFLECFRNVNCGCLLYYMIVLHIIAGRI